jgi:SPP1 family predicted phage head-tail adaptor
MITKRCIRLLNDILYFPIVKPVKDELGQIEENANYKRMVFCQRKSVPQSEFFNAGQSGIKAECVLVVNTLDFQNENKVKYKNRIYDIYREYERPDERTELYCMVKANG